MTEEEAKTKWCHVTRMRTLYDVAARDGEAERDERLNCIASACMAWRWSKPEDTAAFMALVRSKLGDGDNYQKVLNAALKEHRERFVRTEGHCGLAGSPQ